MAQPTQPKRPIQYGPNWRAMVKRRLDAAGWSIPKLARAADISERHMYRWIHGLADLGSDKLARILSIMDIRNW